MYKLIPLVETYSSLLIENNLFRNKNYICCAQELFGDIIEVFNNKSDIENVYNKKKELVDKLCYDKDIFFYIYEELSNKDYSKLCLGIKLIRKQYDLKNKKLNFMDILNNKNNNEKKIDLCGCDACNKFEYMRKKLKESLLLNDLKGVVINLIPSFITKYEFHLLNIFTINYEKKLNFFY